jgi:Spy/CpxP family protein refolding chaperone
MRGTWIKNSVLLLGMTLSGVALLAQQAAPPAPETATQTTADVTAKPQLSAEQRKQMRELRLAARDQAAIIRHDQTLSPEQKMAKLKELRASTRQQMKSVLTPEQQNAFAARRADFAAKLGLTADQRTKLKDLFRSNRRQRLAVLNNPALTNAQKQAQLAQIRQASQSQLTTILTPEQLEKFHQMRRMHNRAKQG